MRRALFGLGALGLLVAAGAGGWWLLGERRARQFAATPFGSADAKILAVPAGTGPRALSNLLASGGVVSGADDFYQFIRRQRAASKLKAGQYEFKGALTPDQVLEKIIRGEVKTYRVTIPEGLRADDILDLLAQSELRLDRQKLGALADDKIFLKRLGVPAHRIEGFLYPDTYVFAQGADEAAVIGRLVARSLEEYRKADVHRKAGVDLDPLQTLTLASIIEKETAAPEERSRISCVFHNRLRLRMRLGTDPTVLYAMMLIRGKYVNNITSEDLRTPHPYNTYTSYGLPPGPIANPGGAAIDAALSPIACHDLYFVSRNNGTHEFCPDLKCHNAAVEKWQRRYFRDPKHKPSRAKKHAKR